MTYLSLFFSVLMLSISVTINGQQQLFSGPESVALGHSKLFDSSTWSSLNNSANLSYINDLCFGATYGLPFKMTELSNRAANVIWPNQFGTFSGVVTQSGYNKSHYTGVSVGYSRLFAKNIAAGFQFNYLMHNIQNSERASSFYSRLSILLQATKVLKVGLLVQNAEQSKLDYGNRDEKIPTVFNAGLHWQFSDIRIITELEKEIDFDPVYKTGLELKIKEILFVRGGMAGRPVRVTFGAGVIFSGISIDAGFSHHQTLGLSSAVGISYRLTQKTK